MPELIEVPTGTASDRVYLVVMDEDTWAAYPEETKQHCYETWLKRAAPLANVTYAALRLVPDELFPSGPRTSPYIEWQQKIERDTDEPFRIRATVYAEFRGSRLEPSVRADILRLITAKYPPGTKWFIQDVYGNNVADGRL